MTGQDALGINGLPDYSALAAMLRACANALDAAAIHERSGDAREAALLRLDEASRLADAGAALRFLLEHGGADIMQGLVAAGGVEGLDVETELGALLPRGRMRWCGVIVTIEISDETAYRVRCLLRAGESREAAIARLIAFALDSEDGGAMDDPPRVVGPVERWPDGDRPVRTGT